MDESKIFKILGAVALPLIGLIATIVQYNNRPEIKFPEPRQYSTQMDFPKIKREIERDSFAVYERPGKLKDPNYAYTIGLWDHYQHPEIIIVGKAPVFTRDWFKEIRQKMERGQKFEVGKDYLGLFGEANIVFMEVDSLEKQYRLLAAFDYYENWDFPVLQLVWQDIENRFPWEEGASRYCREMQPILNGDSSQTKPAANSTSSNP